MKTIIGVYSQFSYNANIENYESVVNNSLKPILTYLYNYPSFKLVLRLSIAEYEWIEKNNPGIFMLLKDLCSKGQIETLSSSYYDAFLTLTPSSERTSHIEKTTTYLRKNFSKKPKGLWINYQVFSPSILPALELSSLDYLMISNYNQSTKTEYPSKPFIMDEIGKQVIVFPFDDSLSISIADKLKNTIKSAKLFDDIKKQIKDSSSQVNIYMLNLDILSKYEGIKDVYPYVFNLINSSILPSTYIEEHSIGKYGYLNPGSYGKDYSLGKYSSINQLILDDALLSKNYFNFYNLYDTVKNIKRGNDHKSELDELIKESSCSAQFVPDNTVSNDYRKYCSHKFCEIERILSSLNLYPLHQNQNDILINKSFILSISNKGAVINKFNYLASSYDFCMNSEMGLFYENFKDSYSSKVVNVSNKDFEVINFDSKKGEIVAVLNNIECSKKAFSLKKSYKIKNNALILNYDIFNNSNDEVKDVIFESIFNLSFDCEPSFSFDSASIKSFSHTDSRKEYIFSCIFNEETPVCSKSVLGNNASYQYTQFRFHKPLNLKPMQSFNFSLVLKIDRFKEKNNDTKQ